eukprot:39226-Eustigmatos_ZCMA.PRE.1
MATTCWSLPLSLLVLPTTTVTRRTLWVGRAAGRGWVRSTGAPWLPVPSVALGGRTAAACPRSPWPPPTPSADFPR